MSTITYGTIQELRNQRALYRRMRDAVVTLHDLGYGGSLASDLIADLTELRESEFAVTLPCLICKTGTPCTVRVNSDDVPSVIICGRCSSTVDQIVRGGGE